MTERLEVTLVRSPIGSPQKMRATLRGLGLTRMHKTVLVPNRREFRGMVRKVIHLVRVREI